MTIKKTTEGWTYQGLLYKDKKSALRAKKADESGDDQIDLSGSPRLVYDSEHPTSFGEFVAEYLRKQETETIQGLAKAVGVSKQSFYSWIKGDAVPNSKKVDRLIEVMGATREEIALALQSNFRKSEAKTLGLKYEEYTHSLLKW